MSGVNFAIFVMLIVCTCQQIVVVAQDTSRVKKQGHLQQLQTPLLRTKTQYESLYPNLPQQQWNQNSPNRWAEYSPPRQNWGPKVGQLQQGLQKRSLINWLQLLESPDTHWPEAHPSSSVSCKKVESEFIFSEYGENDIKLLQVRKEGKVYYIKEIEVSIQLTLSNHRDYIFGDNSDVIAADSQKNTVYALAKQHGISTIEDFALLVSCHFVNKYKQVNKAKVYIEEAPWKRINMKGQEHYHAFVLDREATRYCEAEHSRFSSPVVSSGIKDLKIIKTTKSSFANFVDDECRTLPDVRDRIFSTVVQSRWTYNTTNINFDKSWECVKRTVLDAFAGPPKEGIFSPSVQNTLYLAEQNVLSYLPQVTEIEMSLPDLQTFRVDFTKFPKLHFENNNVQIYTPVDKPSGNVKAAIRRETMLSI